MKTFIVVLFVVFNGLITENALADFPWSESTTTTQPDLRGNKEKIRDQAIAELDSLETAIIRVCKKTVAAHAYDFLISAEEMQNILEMVSKYESKYDYWSDFLLYYGMSLEKYKKIPANFLTLHKYEDHLMLNRDSDGSVAKSLVALSRADFNVEIVDDFNLVGKTWLLVIIILIAISVMFGSEKTIPSALILAIFICFTGLGLLFIW